MYCDTREDFRFRHLLKACVKRKDLHEGIRVHDEISRRGLLENNIFLATDLIDMYAKCGDLAQAQLLLEEIHAPNVVSWNALISGYLHHEQYYEALCCFKRMQIECLCPNVVTLTCILKACGLAGAVGQGKQIHRDALHRGFLGNDIVLGNALVDMYVKCGMFSEAQQVLDELPVRTVVSWSLIIAGFTHAEKGHEALHCFERMQSERLSPDTVVFTCILKACGQTEAIDKGKQIHDEIVQRGLLGKDVALGNALMDMYTICGMTEKARDVFVELCIRDAISWNVLISGYARQGQACEALECLEAMRRDGFSPEPVTWVSILTACANSGAIDKGKQIHCEIAERGFLKTNIVLGTALVDMYAKCGCCAKARELLEALPTRNVATWNALVSSLIQQGQDYEALNSFEEMQNEGISPNIITFTSIATACGNMQAIDRGQRIHDEIVSCGLLAEQDIMLTTALANMYAKHRVLEKVKEMIGGLPFRNIVSWNALIAGYSNAGLGLEALKCLDHMQNQGLSPNITTFTYILRACARGGAINKGLEIHREIQNWDFFEKDIVLCNALVDMYAKCGMLSNARELLESLHLRDVVSWSILIKAHVEQEQAHEALVCYERMGREGVFPNHVTYISVLKACGGTGAINNGRQLHEEIVRLGLLEKDISVGTALVDMYAKCGALERAEQTLEELPLRNVVSWSALMAGYSNHGQGHNALVCLEKMRREGLPLDAVAFLCVLTACNHCGLLWHAQNVFGDMTQTHGIAPKIEHLTSMVVGLGSVCNFKEALSVITLSKEYLVVWLALLGVCRKRGNMALGISAFKRTMHCDPPVYALARTPNGIIGPGKTLRVCDRQNYGLKSM